MSDKTLVVGDRVLIPKGPLNSGDYEPATITNISGKGALTVKCDDGISTTIPEAWVREDTNE